MLVRAASGRAGAWRRRTRLPLTALALAALLTLAGCGVVADRVVSDPLQLDGVQIKVDLPAASLRTAVAGSGTTPPLPFVDRELSEGPLGPRRLRIDGGFEAFVTIVDGGDAYPDRLTLSAIALDLRLWEGASSFDEAAEDARLELPFGTGTSLTLDKLDPACDAAPCLYRFALPILAASSLPLELSGGDLRTALAILTGGSNANFLQVTLDLDVEAEPALAAGSAAVLTLTAPGGILGF